MAKSKKVRMPSGIRNKLTAAIAMLLVSAVMLTTASYAWFTMGSQASATGMNVTAETASSLLIINAKDMAETAVAAAFKAADNDVTLGAPANKMKPATAYATGMAGLDAAPASGLVTLADSNKVNNATGQTLEGASYAAAAENTNYYDYVLYLAAAGSEMKTENFTLQATVTLPDSMLNQGTLATYIHNAFSIQFIVKDTKTGTARTQTINLHQVDEENGNSLTVNLGTTVIPAGLVIGDDGTYGDVNDYVSVTMRVYYDGALADGTNTYIRNEKISGAAAAFNVQFDYKQAPAA